MTLESVASTISFRFSHGFIFKDAGITTSTLTEQMRQERMKRNEREAHYGAYTSRKYRVRQNRQIQNAKIIVKAQLFTFYLS